MSLVTAKDRTCLLVAIALSSQAKDVEHLHRALCVAAEEARNLCIDQTGVAPGCYDDTIASFAETLTKYLREAPPPRMAQDELADALVEALTAPNPNCFIEIAALAMFMHERVCRQDQLGRALSVAFNGPDVPPTFKQVVSIQVQPTKQNGEGTQLVSKDDELATHWSVYTRNSEGLVDWVSDFPITLSMGRGFAEGQATALACRLSMEHQAYIERIK